MFLKRELWSLCSRQRDREILQQEEEKTKENEPKQPCVLCLAFLPLPASHLCAWSKSHHAGISSCCAHRSEDAWHSLCSGYPSLQVARLPPQLFLRVMGGFRPCSMYFIIADVPESFQPNYAIKTKNKTTSPDDNRISIEIFPTQKH